MYNIIWRDGGCSSKSHFPSCLTWERRVLAQKCPHPCWRLFALGSRATKWENQVEYDYTTFPLFHSNYSCTQPSRRPHSASAPGAPIGSRLYMTRGPEAISLISFLRQTPWNDFNTWNHLSYSPGHARGFSGHGQGFPLLRKLWLVMDV